MTIEVCSIAASASAEGALASAPGVAEKLVSVTFDAASSAASRNSLAKVSKKRTCAALVRPAAAFEGAGAEGLRAGRVGTAGPCAVCSRFVAAFTSDTPSASTKAMASVPATCAVKTTSNVPRIETSAYVSL